MVNEVLDAVTHELNTAQIEYSVDPSRRHLHLKFRVGDIEKTQVIPKTSSDWRAAKNARSLLRNTLRQLGVSLIKTPDIEEPAPLAPTETTLAARPHSYLLLEQALATSQRLETSLMGAKTKVAELEVENAKLRKQVEDLAAVVEDLRAQMTSLAAGTPLDGLANSMSQGSVPRRTLPYLRPSVIRRLLRA